MKRHLFIIYLLIVLLPLGVVAWLGVKVANDEQAMVSLRFQEVLQGRLQDVDGQIQRELEGIRLMLSQELTALAWDDNTELREWIRSEPLVRHVLVLGEGEKSIHPPGPSLRSESEERFVMRISPVIKDLLAIPSDNADKTNLAVSKQISFQSIYSAPTGKDEGWHVWFWQNGLDLIFWQRNEQNWLIAVELDRSALLSHIVATLPETQAGRQGGDGTVVLADTRGRYVYQWGNYALTKDASPQALISLSYPLNAWKLKYFMSDSVSAGGQMTQIILGLIILGTLLTGLAIYFYRDQARTVRDARQRVNFVNQVSHELKTPLTNIRMYAELLEGHVEELDDKPKKHLHVITSESQRLSRLIRNVLMFASHQKGKITRQDRKGCMDDLIRDVLEDFAPAFEKKGIAVSFEEDAKGQCSFDPDIVEQILANLFSNVEKYAADGKAMRVKTWQKKDTCFIQVSDKGPGIPTSQKEKIFSPFHRVRDDLTEGVSGTGIGLSLARDLARLHGGDLYLLPSDEGTCFELVLKTSEV